MASDVERLDEAQFWSSCGHPLVFKLAWYVNLTIAYVHVFILLLALTGTSVVKSLRVRVLVGSVVNVAFVIIGWVLFRQPYACTLEMTTSRFLKLNSNQNYSKTLENATVSGGSDLDPTTLYINPLSFPALEGALLGYTGMEVMKNFFLYNRRQRAMILIGVLLAAWSMLWFHHVWHAAFSIVQGVLVNRLCGALLHFRSQQLNSVSHPSVPHI